MVDTVTAADRRLCGELRYAAAMDAPAVLSPGQLHKSRTATLGWALAGAPADSVGERGAAEEVLASVRTR